MAWHGSLRYSGEAGHESHVSHSEIAVPGFCPGTKAGRPSKILGLLGILEPRRRSAPSPNRDRHPRQRSHLPRVVTEAHVPDRDSPVPSCSRVATACTTPSVTGRRKLVLFDSYIAICPFPTTARAVASEAIDSTIDA